MDNLTTRYLIKGLNDDYKILRRHVYNVFLNDEEYDTEEDNLLFFQYETKNILYGREGLKEVRSFNGYVDDYQLENTTIIVVKHVDPDYYNLFLEGKYKDMFLLRPDALEKLNPKDKAVMLGDYEQFKLNLNTYFYVDKYPDREDVQEGEIPGGTSKTELL